MRLSRSFTARVEHRAVLRPLGALSFRDDQRALTLPKIRRRYRRRLRELADWSSGNARAAAVTGNCRLCSDRDEKSWRCKQRFCPFCYARAVARVFEKLKPFHRKGLYLVGWRQRVSLLHESDVVTPERASLAIDVLAGAHRKRLRNFNCLAGAYASLPLALPGLPVVDVGVAIVSSRDKPDWAGQWRSCWFTKRNLVNMLGWAFAYQRCWLDGSVDLMQCIQDGSKHRHLFRRLGKRSPDLV